MKTTQKVPFFPNCDFFLPLGFLLIKVFCSFCTYKRTVYIVSYLYTDRYNLLCCSLIALRFKSTSFILGGEVWHHSIEIRLVKASRGLTTNRSSCLRSLYSPIITLPTNLFGIVQDSYPFLGARHSKFTGFLFVLR